MSRPLQPLGLRHCLADAKEAGLGGPALQSVQASWGRGTRQRWSTRNLGTPMPGCRRSGVPEEGGVRGARVGRRAQESELSDWKARGLQQGRLNRHELGLEAG